MIEYVLKLSIHSSLINNIISVYNSYQSLDYILSRCYFKWDVIESIIQTQSFVGVT